MKKLLFSALFFLALCAPSFSQGCGPNNANCIVPTAPPGTNNNQAASTAFVQQAISGGGSAITALTGDVTAVGPGSVAATLATVNSNVGSFGGANSIPSFTVDAKGRITAASSNVPAIPFTEITGTPSCSQIQTFTGDITNSLCVMTLATVNSNVGTFGDSTHAVTVTADGKGRITAISQTPIVAASSISTPGGRLTPVSAMPVITTSATAVTTLYYAPISGVYPTVPIYNGTSFVPTLFASSGTDKVGLTHVLSPTAHNSDAAYDEFVGLDGSTVRLGTGPNWQSLSGVINGPCGQTSSGGRGTGAGTTELIMMFGICVNANTMTVTYNDGSSSGTFSCPQYRCTYVGSAFIPQASTTLRAAISSTGATSISVTDPCGSGWTCFPYSAPTSPLSFYIKIDSEIMLVTSGNECTFVPGTGCGTYAGTWTVTRAQRGTTAATHLNGAAVNMSPGQTQCSLKPANGSASANGGDASLCAIYNAYNRSPMSIYSRDNVIQWTYTTPNVWHSCNGSNANRFAWFDGLGTMEVEARNYTSILGFGDGGTGIDSTTAPLGLFSLNSLSTNSGSSPSLVADGSGVANLSGNQTLQMPPSVATQQSIGRHYAQCLEYIDTTTVGGHNIVGSGQGYQMIIGVLNN